MTDKLKRLIRDYIEIDWSPEQIVDMLKQGNVIELHHETIYSYILDDKHAGGQALHAFTASKQNVPKTLWSSS